MRIGTAEREEALRLSLERVDHWKLKGAKLSDTVAGLVRRAAAAKPAAPAPAAA